MIGAAGGVLSMSLPAIVSAEEVPLPLLFSAVTFEPSLTSSGGKVTLPVLGSTVTPGGSCVPSFGAQLPSSSFSISIFLG